MKLMIVEDETLCRENLVTIPWDSVGVKLVASAGGVSEAIQKAKAYLPDIIITDIEMDDGTGFQLVHELMYILPGIKIIFLTAYDKFEYAKEAINYKAYAFILKPLNRRELLQTVKNAAQDIEKTQEEQNKFQTLLNDFSNCKYFLKDYFLSAAAQQKGQFNSLFPGIEKGFCFQIIIVAHFDKERALIPMKFQMFSDIAAILKQYEYTVIPFYNQDILTYVFRWDTMDDKIAANRTFEAASVIKTYMEYHNDANNFTIAIGSVADEPSFLPYCYQRSKGALKYRFSLGENNIIYIDDIEPREHSVANIEELKTDLIDSIKIGDISIAKNKIHTIFNNMRENYTSIDIAQRICFEIFIMISIAMSQLGQKPEALFDKTEIWSVLKNHQALPNLMDLMTNIVEVAILLITSTREEKNNDIINHVKNLIETNTDSDISLQKMAKRVYISPCYLSSLFKQRTGISYKNYITQVKINKAKKLLSDTDKPIYEIATSIGYKSSQHFSHLFQDKTGLLPTEYRSRHRSTL
ncbi:MAG: helix-turn-helix domain-containing protein [Clostridia bacterium]|nr:helix-turn-helix domain-containing protein [Clostridia bacterium]